MATNTNGRCIVIWETGADGVPELEFVAPRATVPAHEEARARNSENWPRMLTPLRPCSPLGIDDLQDWAHEEDCEIGLN